MNKNLFLTEEEKEYILELRKKKVSVEQFKEFSREYGYLTRRLIDVLIDLEECLNKEEYHEEFFNVWNGEIYKNLVKALVRKE